MKNNFLKRSLKLLFVSLRTFIIIIMLLVSLLQVAFVQNFLLEQLNKALSYSDQRLEVKGLSGFVPFSISWDELVYSQGEKQVVVSKKGKFSWNPFQLINNKLKIYNLSSERIKVSLPEAANNDAEKSDNASSFPLFLVALDQVELPVVELDKSVIGEARNFSLVLNGSDAPAHQLYNLHFNSLGATDHVHLTWDRNIDTGTHNLTLQGKITDQVLLGLAGLKDGEVQLKASGNGNLKKWSSELNFSAGSYHGAFSLNGKPEGDTAESTLFILNGQLQETLKDGEREIVSVDSEAVVSQQYSAPIKVSSANIKAPQGVLKLHGDVDIAKALATLDYKLSFTSTFEESLGGLKVEVLKGPLTISDQAITLATDTASIIVDDIHLPLKLFARLNYMQQSASVNAKLRAFKAGNSDDSLGTLSVEAKYKDATLQGNIKGDVINSKPFLKDKASLVDGTTLSASVSGALSDLSASVEANGEWGRLMVTNPTFKRLFNNAFSLDFSWPDTPQITLLGDVEKSGEGWLIKLHKASAEGVLSLTDSKIVVAPFKEGYVCKPEVLGSVNGRAFKVLAEAYYDMKDLIELRSMKLQGGDLNTVTAKGRYNIKSNTFNADGHIKAEDLGRINYWKLQRLGGQLFGTFNVEHSRKKSNATVSLQGKRFYLNSVWMNQFEIKANARDLLAKLTAQAALSAKDGKVGSVDVYVLDGDVSYKDNKVGFTTSMQGNNNYAFKGEAAGAYHLTKPPKVKLQKFNFSFGKESVRLEAPISINIGPENKFNNVIFLGAGGKAAVNGTIINEKINLSVSLHNLTNDAITNMLGRVDKVRGLINGDVNITGTLRNPVIDVATRIESLVPGDAWLNSTGLTYKNGRLRADLSLNSNTFFLLSQAAVPMEISFSPFQFSLNDSEKLSLNAEVGGDISIVNQIFSLTADEIKGQAFGSLSLSGTLRNLQHKCDIQLSEGVYLNTELGLEVNGVDIHLKDVGNKIIIPYTQLRDRQKNNLGISGHLRFNEDFLPELNIEAKTDKFCVMHEPSLGGTSEGFFAGTAKIDGPVDRLNISVNGAIGPFVKYLGTTSSQSIPKIEIEHRNAFKEDEDQEDRQAKQAGYYDIKIKTKENVRVHGQGLESYWGGELGIEGPDYDPKVTGVLQLQPGSFYKLLDKEIKLSQGTVKFDGSFDPILEIRAQYELGDATAYFDINGSASNIRTNIYSSPPMKQEEILSRILFSKNKESISPTEAFKLSLAAASIGTDVGGAVRSFLDRLNSFVKIDFQETEDPITHNKENTLELRKNFTPKTFMKVEVQGLIKKESDDKEDSASARFGVGHEIADGVSVVLEVNSKGGPQAGLRVRRKYK